MKLVEQRYQTLPFPSQEVAPPELSMNTEWTLNQLLGMMSSMSPVAPYQADHGKHPVEEIYGDLSAAWGAPEEPRLVRWLLFFKIGRQLE